MSLTVSTWKYAKTWVYSISYDEALADLARFVLPVHEELGIPGHLEVVAGQMGEIRHCGASSYNGMRHMNAGELKSLIDRGWGVGCHSWSHEGVKQDMDLELRQAREKIEQEVERPVTVYCSPGDNSNLTEDVRSVLRGYGYLGGMSITDDVNRPQQMDPLFINRVPIHEEYPGVFSSGFDAHKRISQAKAERGWIVDYLHCPLEEAVHPNKDCSEAHHRQRLEAVTSEGGDDCWFANPDDVVDYHYMRIAARVAEESPGRFRLRLGGLPAEVVRRELTFEVAASATPEAAGIIVDGRPASVHPLRPGVLAFTTEVQDGSQIIIGKEAAQ